MKVEWPEFASVLATLLEAEKDEEENYKETFRVFSKDDEGCIPAQEMKFVLSQICSMEVGVLVLLILTVNLFRNDNNNDKLGLSWAKLS